jgi:hypothetical protein
MHEEAVSPGLVHVLKTVLPLKELSGFSLGGGTSLALRFGHRRSIDLDLFSREPFDSQALQSIVNSLFLAVQFVNRTTGSLCVVVEKCQAT